MKTYGYRGTITVFFSILLILFLSLACTLVESARVQGARARAGILTELGMFSVFGEYERALLEDYDVLFLDGGYGKETLEAATMEKRLKEYMEANAGKKGGGLLGGFQMFPLRMEECAVEGYALMTDNAGSVFYQQAVKNVKETLGTEIVSRYLEWREESQKQEQAAKEYTEKSQSNRTELARMEQEVRKAKEAEALAAQENGTAAANPENTPAVQVENPLEIIEKIKKMGILGLVVKDESMVSSKTTQISELPSGRKRNQGNLDMDESESGLTAEAIFQDYLVQHFPSMTDKESEGALDYQVEYILGGKDSDQENLKYVVNRLLLLREGTNFLCAAGNAQMRGQAQTLAAAVAGVIGSGLLTPLVTTALLLAWAYGESLLDVRTLLAGGRVELIKTAATWKLSLENLGRILEVLGECDQGGGEGLNYEEYLRVLLAAGSREKYPMRALDMIEANLRRKEETSAFRADNCVAKIAVKADWDIPPVFISPGNALLWGTPALTVAGSFGY